MAFLNFRRNVLYTIEASRDTIALALCAFRLFARNNKPFKCRKGYRLHSICYHDKQAGHVCVQHTRDLSKTTVIPKLRPGTTLNLKGYKK